ncbi:MAG: PAS domain-containing protein [Myxococcales bacterium]|nr:PAS domain-containing protein [Myxococcales bacterium]
MKLTWLTVFRTVATSLLLVAIAARLLSELPTEGLGTVDSASFLLIGVVYTLTLAYGLLLRRGRAGAPAAYLQVIGDVLLASCLVYLTGGADSPFTFTYSIAVVAASILLYQRGALVAAGASSLAFASLALAVQVGLLHPPLGSAYLATSRVVFLLVSNVLAQFLIAALASYLARQLSAAGGRLDLQAANLEQISRLQNQIVNSMPSGLITCEADGTVTFVNPAAASILGLEARRPRNIEEIMPQALQLGPGVRRAELSLDTPSGKRSVGLTITSLAGKAGSLLVVFQDLTDLRRVEEELRRLDRLASLGKLSAQLAHEIRNPLASMRGAAQMLASEPVVDSESARLGRLLVRESDRLSALVDDILRFARPPPPVLKPVNLRSMVAETLEMMRSDPLAQGVDLRQEGGEAAALGDEAQLRQVMLNLVRNALAAVGPGGRVRVKVEGEDGAVGIRVWDSAGSIPPADMARLFDPFYTTRAGGTGLGLSTAHSIIAAHGGRIEVASSPEEGTEFVVRLPKSSEGSR